MATIRPDPRNPDRMQVRFSYGGKEFNKSLGQVSSAQAEAARARVDDILSLIARGRLTIPEGADPGTWIVTDGRMGFAREAARGPPLTLAALIAA